MQEKRGSDSHEKKFFLNSYIVIHRESGGGKMCEIFFLRRRRVFPFAAGKVVGFSLPSLER